MQGLSAALANPSLQQCREALDHRRLLDGLPVADDLDLECADDVADESYPLDCATGRDQRRSDREESVAGADCIDDLASNGGDRVNRVAAFICEAAVLAVGDDE